MNHQTRDYMNTVHVSENYIISYIIFSEIIDDDTEHVCVQLTRLMLRFAIFVIINCYY